MKFPIHIRDRGRTLLLDYEQFLDYHDGSALAGAAVAWRAMERASMVFSEDDIWNRADLIVSARHDGPGVRDALEYVTRCFTRERFSHDAPQGGGGSCSNAIDFHFTVSDGRRVLKLQLRDGVVPASFFAAVSRCRDEPDSEAAKEHLSAQKALAAAAVADRELTELFECSIVELMTLTGAAHA